MKRFFSLSVLLLLALASWAQAKYVFYFIGDGMGVNQVCGTETYLASLEGRIGVTPLCMAKFPFTALSVTNSATNGVTDSAAGGSALSSGNKTKNGALGVLKDGVTRVPSVAELARDKGKAVGVATSVSIDHATPAAFYAHVENRSMHNKIGHQMIEAGFVFYAGSDFLQAVNKEDSTEADLYTLTANAGYTIAKGYKDFQKKAKKAERMLLLQSDKANAKDHSALPYAIDRTKNDMSLAEITRAGISFLTKKDKGNGFFFFIEGGKIDWACHANDAATVFKEIIDMDEAVRVAYEFYEQHPDETLIVITADHETGGVGLGTGAYKLNLSVLAHQRMSSADYTAHIRKMREEYGHNLTWPFMQNDLKENWGFWDKIPLTDHQSQRLQRAFEALMNGMGQGSKTLYQQDDALCDAARRTMQEIALTGWVSTGHSNGIVPVFAIGAGADRFTGMIENIDIPKRIIEAADLK